MIRIFETGDLHIGRNYSEKKKHPRGNEISEKRLEAIKSMVDCANREKCDLFAVTGDLFDKTNGISKKRITNVVESLSAFNGTVLVLPGNHDYYPDDSEPDVWKTFNAVREGYDNIVLLNSFEPYEFSVGDEDVTVYPAYCHVQTATENNLEWIKMTEIPTDGTYRIGMAHGAIQGHTIDKEGVHFLMTEKELNEIPVDVWLIGHTHVMFPDNLTDEYKNNVGKIFNAGSHVQTDVGNNTEGNCFIIEIEKDANGNTNIRAKKYLSGNIFFKRLDVDVTPDGTGKELETEIKKKVAGLKANTSVSLVIRGTVSREEYEQREEIYSSCLKGFFEYPHPTDNDLMELITEEFIKSEFSEVTFPAKLLLELVDDPKTAQLAYELLISKECKA